ncbi:aminotransferase [Pseudorhodoferax aquiterrae]|uniref:Aminotransferase n=1 Tax=Pseudorhodoferax aquiterrae TaxID=747304 RepID=A0ABQ3G3L4_9BURK|nr:DegT/DnrJ/EryC1/StrS family aminotransferase [Pseudorhodoferax aquiterrae]GHC87700.1 aminotransferase [Pseudorhodoferax aquiterrae]
MLINDLNARVRQYRPAICAAVESVIETGWFVLGPQVKAFEAEFASYLHVNHCISVANGTDAIELALKALGVEIGDLVATVANAGMYTTAAVNALGARPMFMDVDLETHNIAHSEVEKAIAAGAKVVVVTHLYGQAVPEIAEISRSCKRAGVALLEDCAQAHGARSNGQRVGSFGDAASFSFYPTKNLGALGDGGAVVTNSDAIAKAVTTLRQYGWTSKYHVGVAGGRNSRLDEIQAAILRIFLPDLDASNERRRSIAHAYGTGIHHPAVRAPLHNGEGSVAHLYVIRSSRRDELKAHLQAVDISSDVHYPVPDHRQQIFGALYAHIHLPNTERLASEVLTLPCYPEMTDDQVARVIATVNAWKQ